MLAQHREIYVVLDRNILSEAAAQKAEDIEVLQPCDVGSQGNTARARIDRSRYSHHDMAGPIDFDPDALRQLLGTGGDLLCHVGRAPWVGGLSQFRHDTPTRIGNRCGELRAAEVRRETIGCVTRHWRALRGSGDGRGRSAAASSATPKNSSWRRRRATDKAPTTPARLPRVLVRTSTGRGAICNSSRATLSAKSARAPTDP